MSDEETVAPAPPPVDRLAQRRAALEKARTAKAANRHAAPRTATPRTSADSAVGVSAHPGPAERRQEPTREAYRSDAPEPLTRRRRSERTVGGFEVPANRRKPGWDYQWITIRVLNEPVDSARIRDFREGGWRPVLARDIPEMVEEGATRDTPIETEGQRLYTRPMTLTNEAKAEDHQYATEQQRDRMMAAASGKSAIRGDEHSIPNARGVTRVPVSIEIEGVAG